MFGRNGTVTPFNQELRELRGLIAQMGGLAEQAVDRAMTALQRGDTELAAAIRADDARVDAMAAEVERTVVRMVAGRTPAEADIREAIAALKIAAVIERIADYAKNIAKRVPLLESDSRIEPLSTLPAMGRMAAEMVRDALDAFAARDAAAAQAVSARDRALDDFYDSIFRVLVTHMVENPNTIGQVAHLLFVAKNLERIGDHATNIADMVYFAATGAQMAERERGTAALG